MNVSANIDFGQMLIATLIAIVGWFIKKEITDFGKRLDKHEDVIFNMTQTISTVLGQVGILNKFIGADTTLIEMHRRVDVKQQP